MDLLLDPAGHCHINQTDHVIVHMGHELGRQRIW